MERLRQDFRVALRRLRKSPGFAAVAIVTLALGIGANATIFSVINTILFRPLAVSHSGELVALNRVSSQNFPTFSYPDYRDLSDRNDVLSDLAAYRFMRVSMSREDSKGVVWGYEATGNYFDMLGIQAIRGRVFHQEDDLTPGANPVAVLSFGCWQRRFGADPNLIGQAVRIDGLGYTVLGIAPPSFKGTEIIFSPDVWVPMMMQGKVEPGNEWIHVRHTLNIWLLGRLKPGITGAQAAASLNRIAAQLSQEHPDIDEGAKIKLSQPGLLGDMARASITRFATVLMAVAGLVILIACTNLASMLLARASDRRKEIAVRLAIGAGRARLIRQLLTESLVLAIAGGAAGLLLAVWLADLFSAWRPSLSVPINFTAAIDWRVLVFTAGVSIFTVILVGLAPAFQTTKTSLVPALKGLSTSGARPRWELRDVLVGAQVAMCATLLTASILVVRSLQ